MNRSSSCALAMTAIATVLLACSSSGSNPVSQAASTAQTTTAAQSTPKPSVATPASASKEFVSKRYGFRVTLTDNWSEQDASVDWDGATLQGTESSEFANFPDQTVNRTLVVAAAPVPKGEKLAQWRAAMHAATPFGCSDPPSVEKTTLGGEPALAWTTVCIGHANVIKLAALHGNRGYIFFLASDWANDKAADRRTFNSIRESFRFTT
jgi:hypothetical protein